MATLYTHEDSNVRKTWLLMALFFLVIIALGWFASYYYGNPAILFFAVGLSIITNIGSYWFSDKIVIKMSGARPFDRSRSEELWDIVENLSITAGLPMPKIYIIEDPSPNAFATGRDKEHAVVAVTTGLIALLNKNEIEGVIAHELSHIGNRDMLVSTVAVVLVGFVTLLSDFFIRFSFSRGDRNRKMHPIVILVGLGLMILSPIIATLLRLAISRKREFLADASGALLTRYPEGLASALGKISQYGRPLIRANHATAHLYITNPFSDRPDGEVGFLTKLFMTHPPIKDRIEALLNRELRN